MSVTSPSHVCFFSCLFFRAPCDGTRNPFDWRSFGQMQRMICVSEQAVLTLSLPSLRVIGVIISRLPSLTVSLQLWAPVSAGMPLCRVFTANNTCGYMFCRSHHHVTTKFTFAVCVTNETTLQMNGRRKEKHTRSTLSTIEEPNPTPLNTTTTYHPHDLQKQHHQQPHDDDGDPELFDLAGAMERERRPSALRRLCSGQYTEVYDYG